MGMAASELRGDGVLCRGNCELLYRPGGKFAFRESLHCVSESLIFTLQVIMFKEFKEFALKGNLIDMAVAFVMGAAFTKLSTAFIEDLVMPWVGLMGNGMDFTNKFIALSDKVTAPSLAEARKQGAVLAYGDFITVVINFLIVAFVMFLVVKAINQAKKMAAKEEAVTPAPAPVPSAEERLLTEIRDLLKAKG
jgi:large conductance mechanosensitive channel